MDFRETLYFLGGLFPKEREERIRSMTKYGLQSAANCLQWKFVRGFDACLGPENVRLINSEYIGSFPLRYREARIPRYDFCHADGMGGDVGAGFTNLPIVKEFSRAASLNREIDRISCDADTQLYFVGYAATYPIVKALRHAKRRFPQSVTCLIVPDLPQYMMLNKRGGGFLHRIKNAIVDREMRNMDCYVPLTSFMIPHLGSSPDHCAIVEGIADADSFNSGDIAPSASFGRYILYSGTLQYRYGIGELLTAFGEIEDRDLSLVICGDGEAVDEIKSIQEKDPRVRYLGVLPLDAVTVLRSGARLLVNPRKNEEEYTKYSFPSKMMEYLSSGVPTVAFKLDGMPDDYDGLFIDATASGLKASIERGLNMSPADATRLADRAKTYVLEQKNPRKQCERILEVLRREANAYVQ